MEQRVSALGGRARPLDSRLLEGPSPEDGVSANGSARPALGTYRRWQRIYPRALAVADFVAAVLAGLLAQLVRFGVLSERVTVAGVRVPYVLLAVVSAVLWTAVVAVSQGYNLSVAGTGTEEYRHLLEAGVRFIAVIALLSFALQASVARSVVLIVVPLIVGFSMGVHRLAQWWLEALRRRGRCCRRTLVVGQPSSAAQLVSHLRRAPGTGLQVVGLRSDYPEHSVDLDGDTVPVLATDHALVSEVASGRADAVAIMDPDRLGPTGVRRLAWELEGRGVDLLVVPSLTDVAGPRLRIHPLGGLPLVEVEEARFSGAARVVKDWLERPLAVGALLVLAPVLAAIALAVKVTSPGPVLFRQERVGRHGHRFLMLKFRTMREKAEIALVDLNHQNEQDGLLFKIRQDPRVTPVGKFLRRFSLDELPQLWHVVTGEMSFVGPRPPLPTEVERYESDIHRRLLVKPGLTGLWQVSGRSDLPWEDAVRLDLHYVDNWSLALDFAILLRTVSAVLFARGAY
jgi:exopolysaccharide biosynthesis polyprenyl glycosylphosphotransferase